MTCITGTRECDGCMRCRQDAPNVGYEMGVCPRCGALLGGAVRIVGDADTEQVVACSNCTDLYSPERWQEALRL